MRWFKDNIYERRDVRSRYLLLLLIVFIVLTGRWLFIQFYNPPHMYVDEAVIQSIKFAKVNYKQFEQSTPVKPSFKPPAKSSKTSKSKRKKTAVTYSFQFNPNTLSKDSLKLLGLSSYTINSILKYTSKGGKIRSIDQFSKWNGMTDSMFQRLEPFIQLPKSYTKSKEAGKKKPRFASSDTAVWRKKYKKKNKKE